MPTAAVILVPLLVGALFACAVDLLWRRMSDAHYAASWLCAFWLAALGWAATAVEATLAQRVAFPGSATLLCWFAAVLLAVRGIRQRAGKADRSIVLLAIWVGTAVGVCILMDLWMDDVALVSATVGVLVAGGAAVAAFAIGPRNRNAPLSIWLGAGLAGGFSAFCLILSAIIVQAASPWVVMAATSFVAILALVALGLLTMLTLNDDRAHALERLARTDALTGVWNRRGFEEAAHHLLRRLRADDGTVAAVAIADIDGFKGINDQHGHAVGDLTLIRFVETLQSIVEPGDLLARLGGEEFAILAMGIAGPAMHQRMERVRSLLGVPSIDKSGPPAITASFGVAALDADPSALRDALERADRALYRAKSEGRNRVALAD